MTSSSPIRAICEACAAFRPCIRHVLAYEATFEPATQTLTGIIKLRIRDDVDLKQADPVDQPYRVFEGGD